ncbi:molybdenum cofactor biosynthesis protein MoaE [Pararobbsia silviterrae]|uniref:Molybdopterin synthase catalytic subunit n=1 Tax=Pararobbsia silviterrae TaxID=1792498 RepID=A0A494XW53_9BURK|nr:molybdenum cofactor biosynthesis protein MoaE [Pararobbsia silviterrae]RKP54800.1 molybdenum cofactor biosynthesis protein MoaE [Pararobbsia silviterrae]
MTVRIQTAEFDLGVETQALRGANAAVGALVSFVGTVRDIHDGEHVSRMELEHYPGMTETSIETIVEAARTRWTLIDALVIHRVGVLLPTDPIVLVAVTASHRGEAFAACEFIIDYLKTAAPFWKKETTSAGARWVDARETDDAALARWGVVSMNASPPRP